CWGTYAWGELKGHSGHLPRALVPPGGAAAMGFGPDHICIIDLEGRASCLGKNTSGELGNGENFVSSTDFLPVSGDLKFRQITAGEAYTCGVTISGEGFCWGTNRSGRLGTGSNVSASNVPVEIAGGHSFE